MGTTVTLSLISHTNVGKTTLARTLLRKDVGEVIDQAHVTDVSEAHVLIEADGDVLKLWDTPGFGDTARLMRRLKGQDEPVGWLIHQVWDRVSDRPLWCSQKAVINIKQDADVVLYMVNAAEEPEDAGYIPLELELLTWMERPVLLMLNQVGESKTDLDSKWRDFVGRWPIVGDVLTLDAFTRSWVDEGAMMQRVAKLLEGDKRTAMESLAAAWNRRNLTVFRSSCERLAIYVAGIAVDRETPRSAGGGDGDEAEERGGFRLLTDALRFTALDRKRAMGALNERLDTATLRLMDDLIESHGLHGASAKRIEERLRAFEVKRTVPFNERTGAAAGAVLSGALGGLYADIMTGGLTLGGGMIAGGILGAIGGSALARGFRLVGGRKEPAVRWSSQFLDELIGQVLLRYLAVAHFGRGRGDYRDVEQQAHWRAAIDGALSGHEHTLRDAWKMAERNEPGIDGLLGVELRPVIESVLRRVLLETSPRAGAAFGGTS